MKNYLAEFIGTFTLTSAVLIALGGQWAGYTPMIAGLTVGLFVYTVGAISGAHLNPAITIGAWSIKKIPTQTAVVYVVSQLLAALAAKYLVGSMYPVADITVVNSWAVLVGELVGTMILAFGVSAVVFKRVTQSASGLVIGGSLTLGVLVASGLSNGVLNPAVALGIGSFSWIYVLAPIVGSLIGFQLYRHATTESKTR